MRSVFADSNRALRRSLLPLLLCIAGCRSLRDSGGLAAGRSPVEAAGHARIETECTASAAARPRSLRIGLLGPLFSHQRLYEGTAFRPWQYVFNVGLSVSQCANTLLGGDPDESLSSRVGRSEKEGDWPARYAVAPALDLLIGPDHCEQCIEHEECCSKEIWAW